MAPPTVGSLPNLAHARSSSCQLSTVENTRFGAAGSMQHAASRGILGCMRTTIDLPDELLTQARSRAADEGTTLTALLADGLRLRLARRVPPASARRPLPTSRNRGGMQPWIDPGSNASLLDAADDNSAAA